MLSPGDVHGRERGGSGTGKDGGQGVPADDVLPASCHLCHRGCAGATAQLAPPPEPKTEGLQAPARLQSLQSMADFSADVLVLQVPTPIPGRGRLSGAGRIEAWMARNEQHSGGRHRSLLFVCATGLRLACMLTACTLILSNNAGVL